MNEDKAKKLFKKLGWNVIKNNDEELVYCKKKYVNPKDGLNDAYIIFQKEEKAVGGVVLLDTDEDNERGLILEWKEVQAVLQQIKEFKWNEEDNQNESSRNVSKNWLRRLLEQRGRTNLHKGTL